MSGVAAGLSFALVAACTKLATEQWQHGFFTLFSHWQIYALIITGVLSIVMLQNAYGAGPLAVSQPAMEIIEPLVSVMMGVVLFGDSVNTSSSALVVECAAALMAGGGIWLMGSSERLYVFKDKSGAAKAPAETLSA